jgi:VIT1/CCC1 family predicted Fe2+/Mn2+ transporter
MLAVVAGLVSGALAMTAGEYVSVSSQADTERAGLSKEQGELVTSPAAERAELATIFVARNLSRDLALQVADQLIAHDASGAHASDELGIHETRQPRPIQAALTSSSSNSVRRAVLRPHHFSGP